MFLLLVCYSFYFLSYHLPLATAFLYAKLSVLKPVLIKVGRSTRILCPLYFYSVISAIIILIPNVPLIGISIWSQVINGMLGGENRGDFGQSPLCRGLEARNLEDCPAIARLRWSPHWCMCPDQVDGPDPAQHPVNYLRPDWDTNKGTFGIKIYNRWNDKNRSIEDIEFWCFFHFLSIPASKTESFAYKKKQ